MISLIVKSGREGDLIGEEGVVLPYDLRCTTTMGIFPGQKVCPGRGTYPADGKCIFKVASFPCQAVQVRCLNILISIAAQHIVPLVISQYENDIGLLDRNMLPGLAVRG